MLFDLRPNYGWGNEDNGGLLKMSCVHTAALRASDHVAGHFWPMPLLETPGHSQVNLGQSLVDHCSFLLEKKIGKLNSGHKTWKHQFSFQSQRRAMPKNVQSESESEVPQSCLTLWDPIDSSLQQVPLSIGFSRQEYWSGLTFPSSKNVQTTP